MCRLNSANFRIFEPREWKLILKSPDSRASKIISNDAKLELISWKLNNENPLFSICVGVWVGGHPLTSFSWRLKDAMCMTFGTTLGISHENPISITLFWTILNETAISNQPLKVQSTQRNWIFKTWRWPFVSFDIFSRATWCRKWQPQLKLCYLI